jgi:hypothetical protein
MALMMRCSKFSTDKEGTASSFIMRPIGRSISFPENFLDTKWCNKLYNILHDGSAKPLMIQCKSISVKEKILGKDAGGAPQKLKSNAPRMETKSIALRTQF